MLHWSSLYNVIEKTDKNGSPVEFAMKFVKGSTGELITVERCICTSTSFRPRTVNIMLLPSREIRKIRACSITEINGVEIFI